MNKIYCLVDDQDLIQDIELIEAVVIEKHGRDRIKPIDSMFLINGYLDSPFIGQTKDEVIDRMIQRLEELR